LPIVQALIAAGADVNKMKFADNRNLYYTLFKNRCNEILQILISASTDVNYYDVDDKTLLSIACISNNLPIVQALIAAGADVNKQDNNGFTALIYTSANNQYLIVNENITEQLGIVQTLIAAGADVNKQTEHGDTALLAATNINIVEALIAAGADVNKQDNRFKSTALIGIITSTNSYVVANENDAGTVSAIRLIQLAMVKALLAAGADVNIRNNQGKTALMFAVDIIYVPIVEALIAAGADVHIKDKFGNTALMLVPDFHLKIREILIAAGANQRLRHHPQIGAEQGPVIDGTYKIPMNRDFVRQTQWRPLPLENEHLQDHLNLVPRPHIVWSCPAGHLHSANNCGVPTEIVRCGIEDCNYLVGGLNHYLSPGNYVVYHDGHQHSTIWFGSLTVNDYKTYEDLVNQYNMTAQKFNLHTINLLPEVGVPAARRLDEEEAREIPEDSQCGACTDVFEPEQAVYLLPCNHLIHEECLINARGGDIANVNNGTAENLANRRCAFDNTRFRFKKNSMKKFYVTKDIF